MNSKCITGDETLHISHVNSLKMNRKQILLICHYSKLRTSKGCLIDKTAKKSSKFWLPYSLIWINSLRTIIKPIIAIALTILALFSCFEVYPLITQISNQTQIDICQICRASSYRPKDIFKYLLTFFQLCSHEGSFDQGLKSSSTPLDSITDSKNVWFWQLFYFKSINDSIFSWTKVDFKITSYGHPILRIKRRLKWRLSIAEARMFSSDKWGAVIQIFLWYKYGIPLRILSNIRLQIFSGAIRTRFQYEFAESYTRTGTIHHLHQHQQHHRHRL